MSPLEAKLLQSKLCGEEGYATINNLENILPCSLTLIEFSCGIVCNKIDLQVKIGPIF